MGENSNEVQKVSFFKGLKAEFKKIIWPTRKDIVKETAVVAVTSIILGLIIVVVDMIINLGINVLINLYDGRISFKIQER